MALASGTRIGHYEILGLLGAGGMGEVYRALDPRLGREVAVKILPDALAADSERQKRFEIEARAAGAVNHPNIVTLHDVGMAGSAPYLVTEMLEGETLRALMARGAMAPARALAIAMQVAHGLGAAHAKGIVHRDLKPENLFVLPDGRVKILDFGIAKLTRAEPEAMAETTPALGALTQDGTILGTVSYMAPEQLRGQAVDRRVDLFALGAILHEALVGRPAFGGDTAVDRMTAILSREPEPIAPDVDQALPGLAALIRRCLEKQPENRFESARDLAYALEILEQTGRARIDAGHQRATSTGQTPTLDVQQITFREGRVGAARFAPDGVTVVYHAAWEGGPSEMYIARTDNPDYRPLHLGSAELLGLSNGAELLVGLDRRDVGGFTHLHTLARVSMLGGVPRELARNVFMADWGPDGKSIAAIRECGGLFLLEYPLGRIVYQSSGSWFSQVRVSASGQLAFFEHPQGGNNFGHLMVLEPGGQARKLVSDLETASALVWHPAGKEIWFQAIPKQQPVGLIWAATLDGKIRPIYQALGGPDVQDLSPDGRLLLTRTDPRLRLQTGTRTGAGTDRRELSWFDWSQARDISPDGSHVLFDETGPSSPPGGSVFVRATDGSPAVRIADGSAMGFLPNGEQVLALVPEHTTRLAIHPLRAGASVTIDLGDLQCHFARPFPDGKSVAAIVNRPGGAVGLYRIDIESGECTRLTEHPFAMRHPVITPAGDFVSMRCSDGSFARFPVDGGAPIRIPNMKTDERPCGWSPDGGAVYVFQRGKIPGRVDRIDLTTGERTPWMEIEPLNRSGTIGFITVFLTPDGERYAASFDQLANCLFAVKGLG